MTGHTKIRYEISLEPYRDHPEPYEAHLRTIAPADAEGLARLMLDAYAGTIDYEGETIRDALDEVDGWFAESALLEHSYVALADGALVSAVLTMLVDDAPFIAIVMTDPTKKNAGLGRAVTARSLTSLANAGHDRVVLYITEGNTPSERLFASLGAEPVPSR